MPLRVNAAAAAALMLLAAAVSTTAPSCAQDTPVYKNASASLQARVDDLFGRLTEDEKLMLLGGTGFGTQPIPRLGIPEMDFADAGQGVRGGPDGNLGPATLFPAEITMASTWDPGLIGQVGQALGEELLNKGTGAHILLGPDVNIHRSPLGGRNGESFTEDPYLNAQLAAGYIAGLQTTGAGSCVKHFDANNEEDDRQTVDVHVGERALREIYLPAFKAAVETAHVWAIMPSYNRVNGYHSTASHYLLTDVARHDWGFGGVMISDWGAVHETAGVVNAGCDLEMPSAYWLTPERLQAALASGAIRQSAIDDNVRHILAAIIRAGMLDKTFTPDHGVVNSPAHQQLTYKVATSGIVLLKNDGGILPLDTSRLRSIAVIGDPAVHIQAGAEGSPHVDPFFQSEPLDAIKTRAGSAIQVNYAGAQPYSSPPATTAVNGTVVHGWTADYFRNRDLQGEPVVQRVDPVIDFNWSGSPAHGVSHENFSVRWGGDVVAPVTGRYTFYFTGDDGYRLFVDGNKIIDNWVDESATTKQASLDLVAGQKYAIRAEYYQGGGDAVANLIWAAPGAALFPDAVSAARRADVALVFVSTQGMEGEGQDRPSMDLPGDQSELIRRVAAVNKHVVVVLNNGTPVTMTGWIADVPGLVEAWFPGENGGRAIAAVLFGDVNPSGKLPDTLGARREDYPDFGNEPGNAQGIVNYAEGIYVGYRAFDKRHIAPLFPFGYGLSYTTFRYSGLKLSSATLDPSGTVQATVDVANTGKREGPEVVELYVHALDPTVDRPIRELKGFDKVDLQPGQTKTVTLTLSPQSLAYFDTAGEQWKADPGKYAVEIGASSRDIRLSAPLTLTGVYTVKP